MTAFLETFVFKDYQNFHFAYAHKSRLNIVALLRSNRHHLNLKPSQITKQSTRFPIALQNQRLDSFMVTAPISRTSYCSISYFSLCGLENLSLA
jgi:hypothetical protein